MMGDLFEKLLNLELGILSITSEKVKPIVDELVKKGEMTRGEAKEYIDEIIKKGKENKEKIGEEAKEVIKNYLSEVDIPTREEINELKSEIKELKEKIEG